MKRPNSAANLIRAIKRYCGVNQDDIRLARAMADAIEWVNEFVNRIVNA